MARKKRDRAIDDIAIAMLRIQGFSSTEISVHLSLDAAVVSRSLKSSEGDLWKSGGFVDGPGMALLPPDLKIGAEDRVRGTAMRAIKPIQLRKLTQAELPHLRTVTLVRARNALLPDPDSNNWRAWMEVFARGALPRMKDLLATGDVWGVTWGSHVAAVVDALAHAAGRRHRRRNVAVLPLCGNRFGDRRVSESSSAIAERLGLELAGTVTEPGALTMVPAFILGDLIDGETEPMWKHIGRSTGYREIFGAERIPEAVRPPAPAGPAWVNRLDGVLTSVSRDGFPFGYGENRMYENAGYRREVIDRRYLGDIGGVGLVRPGQARLPILEQRWTGLRPEELQACAARCTASAGAMPGVVVVASGAERATSLLESLRNDYVNHIVIDQSLNDKLVTEWLRLKGKPPKG